MTNKQIAAYLRKQAISHISPYDAVSKSPWGVWNLLCDYCDSPFFMAHLPPTELRTYFLIVAEAIDD